jgi:ADP-heptose:LPS heptosyltransferase/glycosyltransferase involved in cell wall biosynthesis
MKKIKTLVKGPFLTASGYGVHARQVLASLVGNENFDVSAQSIRWGETSFIVDREGDIEKIRQLSIKGEQELAQGVKFDLSVQVTIPNEFQRLAPINVGVTAGIEVDRVSPEWIVKANENVDLVIVPSKHSAQTYSGISYKGNDGSTLQLQRPVLVIPESFDQSVYNDNPFFDDQHEQIDLELGLSGDFNFLCVGLGLDKGMGEDRKNISNLVKWFCEEFKDNQQVGLIMKVSIVGGSLIDFNSVKRRVTDIKRSVGCDQFPRIHIIHGRLSERQMAGLYKSRRVKALISPTHGEGFGLPLLEAAACGLPVMATDWSGHLDFLSIEGNRRRFIALTSKLVEIPASAIWKGVMDQGSRWADPDPSDVKAKMRKMYLSPETPRRWASELASSLIYSHSSKVMGPKLAEEILSFVRSNGSEAITSRNGQMTEKEFVDHMRSQIGVSSEGLSRKKTLIFTMPMSAGDVYISTATIDSLRRKYPDHRIFFATGEKYVSILKRNSNIDVVIPFHEWMMNVPLLERIFDEVYTPNLAIQTLHSNWVHGGHGRRLADEIASQCRVKRGDYFIEKDESVQVPDRFICVNPGSGKGQWSARNYLHWQEVIENLGRMTKLPIVQVGVLDDPAYQGTIDLRGKTENYNQLAGVISRSCLMVGIDSVTMHLAAGLDIPSLSIFGSSYSTSTGPSVDIMSETRSLTVLIDTPSRYSCDKACYKYECSVNKDHPCINEISPMEMVRSSIDLMRRASIGVDSFDHSQYREINAKISGYTHVLNARDQHFPYIQSIRSMLGFCDEVVVVDGGSTDGTRQELEGLKLEMGERLQILDRTWDWSEPGMDGMQKAYARAMCTGDFLWQQDADEVVHENDYKKIKKLVRAFPKGQDLIHLPVIELWGDGKTVRTDRHSWKWRLSRNNFRITHGINKEARLVDPKTGRTFSKRGMSDGCEYIDIMSGEFISHSGFYNDQLERIRISDPREYGKRMNEIFDDLPSVFHYSWADIPRKIRNFRDFWDKCWSCLYGDQVPVPRFKDVITDEDIDRKSNELRERGGEHGQAQTFQLLRENPDIMVSWLENAAR